MRKNGAVSSGPHFWCSTVLQDTKEVGPIHFFARRLFQNVYGPHIFICGTPKKWTRGYESRKNRYRKGETVLGVVHVELYKNI